MEKPLTAISPRINNFRYNGNANAIQHEEFARNYVNDIASALFDFDLRRGTFKPYEFYQDLAWGGLEGTQAFVNLSSQDQQRIRNTVLVELTGKDSNGNPGTQAGLDGGCN